MADSVVRNDVRRAVLKRLINNHHDFPTGSLLEAPCVFCGYNGPNYWQHGTHHGLCPLRELGAIDREDVLLAALETEPDSSQERADELAGQQAASAWARYQGYRRNAIPPQSAIEAVVHMAVIDALRIAGMPDLRGLLHAALGGLRTAPTRDEEWNQQAAVIIPQIEAALALDESATTATAYVAEKCRVCDGNGFVNQEPLE